VVTSVPCPKDAPNRTKVGKCVLGKYSIHAALEYKPAYVALGIPAKH
jgi:hypothetical protein